ncbi:MAG: 4-alpha-glucanotransferase [Acidimicrobiia bacterium]|nr:4-alpha-glucanotransferase [Acidimicrobiia bacterium]
MLTEWVDVWKEPQQVALDDLIAVLEALLQRSLHNEREVAAALDDLRNDRPLLAPVTVAWDGLMPPVALGRPVETASIETEDGDEIPVTIRDGQITADRALPLGYHHLQVDSGRETALVIAAPTLAHTPPRRELGILAPVYSIRAADQDTGIGHFGHLRQLADLALVSGATVIGTLPLVATFSDQPSPYSPASRRAWNEILVDLMAAPGWQGELPTAETDPLWVDYATTGTAIRSELAAYATQTRDMPQIRDQISEFAQSNPEIARYAHFRARCDAYGRNWRVWPSRPIAPADRFDYHMTAQWLAAEQLGALSDSLRRRGQYLYLDLPIGCNPDGYDIWEQPEIYAAASVGAPPDSLFLGGQDWGLPAPIPTRSRRDGHSAFIKAIRHQLSVAGLLRIDHVMGLHRTWWVPHGLSATQGAYVMQPTDEMFAIVCLESHRAQAAVVGENLGTVPPPISEALERHHLLGMKVAQDGLKEPGPCDLVALSTHDTAPFSAWWHGLDIDDAEDLGVYSDGRAEVARSHRTDTIEYLEELLSTTGAAATRDAILEWMAVSEAAIALVNVDDLWEEQRRQNVPGTDAERPNWRARHKFPIEQVTTDARLRSHLERLQELRIATAGEMTDNG